MSVFDASTMRDDIVSRLLGGDADLETNRYLDRLVELSEVEEAEHQFLIDTNDEQKQAIGHTRDPYRQQ